MSETNNAAKVLFLPRLAELCGATGKGGPQWGAATDDLNLTVLTWSKEQGVARDVNNELDVVWIGVEGTAWVQVDDQQYTLEEGSLIVIPRGAARSLRCVSDQCSYLSMHRKRHGLSIENRLV